MSSVARLAMAARFAMFAFALAPLVGSASGCTLIAGTFKEGEGGGPTTGTQSSSSSTAESSSSTTASSTTDASSSSTGSGVCTPATQPCQFTDPQCCPAGNHCVLDYTQKPDNSLFAFPKCDAEGPSTARQPCADDASCKGATLCVDKQCRPTCLKSSDCDGIDVLCGLGLGGYDAMFYPQNIAYVCLDDCDPLAQTGCPGTDKNCQVEHSDKSGGFGSRCVAKGFATQGQSCQYITDCALGLGCYFFGGPNAQCATYCDLTSPVCPGSTTCTATIDALGLGNAVVKGKHYGVCH